MKLFKFQREAVEFLIKTPRALLALDCGLGKSRVCIEAARELKLPLRVIAPAFLKSNWLNEIEKWGYDGDFQVVSYEKAKLIKPESKALLVFDESHYIRKWTAKRTKLCIELGKYFKRCIFSTATPVIGSAADLHPTLSLCQPGKWGKFRDFANEYCNKIPDNFNPAGFRYSGIRNEDKLTHRMSKFTFIRHKKDVMSELPDKRIIPYYIDLTETSPSGMFAQTYEDIERGVLSEQVKSERKRVGLAKLHSIVEFCSSFGTSVPMVIFAWHRDVVEGLARELGCPYIHGDSSMTERADLIETFQEGECSMLVASIGACGVGVNLHRASVGVFAEIPWTAAELKQCEDRLHRIGQKNKVNIYHILAKDTIDEAIYKTVEKKREASAAIGVEL